MEKYTSAHICMKFRYGEKTDLYRVQFLLFLVTSLDTPSISSMMIRLLRPLTKTLRRVFLS